MTFTWRHRGISGQNMLLLSLGYNFLLPCLSLSKIKIFSSLYITESGAAGDRKSLRFIVVSGHGVRTLYIDKKYFYQLRFCAPKFIVSAWPCWTSGGLKAFLSTSSAQQHSIPWSNHPQGNQELFRGSPASNSSSNELWYALVPACPPRSPGHLRGPGLHIEMTTVAVDWPESCHKAIANLHTLIEHQLGARH